MIAAFFSLLLAAQVANGENNCCSSKTVGAVSYTLVDTDDANAPNTCKDSCAYDDGDGNLFCFSEGNLPSTCKGEVAKEIQCIPGCPDENTKIVDAPPTTETEKATYNDCWEFCRSLCVNASSCGCNAWTFDLENGTCYTYAEEECYKLEEADGFISGSLCHDTHNSTGSSLDFSSEAADTSIAIRYACYGNLKNARSYFNDYRSVPQPAKGKATGVTLYTGSYANYDNVIVGIKVRYANAMDGPLHGRQGTDNSINSDPPQADFLYGVKGWSDYTYSPYSFIYGLGMHKTTTQFVLVGRDDIGREYNYQPDPTSMQLSYILGWTTKNNGMLGRVCFVFQKQT
jgi:hypothetical protein